MYLVVPNDIKDIEIYKEHGIDTFILGLKDYSVNYPMVSIEEIKELSTKYKLFIAVNKNIFNGELDDLLSKLKELSKLNILGILYYDIGVLNLVKENNISLDLVWHQTHMVTNYNTCNYYYEKGVKYAYLANEITLDEMIEIKNKSNIIPIVEVFGYPIVSFSRRKLLTNYFKSIDKEKTKDLYKLDDKDGSLLIKENNDGASILNGKITNGTRPLFDLINNNFEYLVLDMQEIDLDTSLKILDKYMYILENISIITDEEKEDIISYTNNLVGDNTNFFYKKTIYKVKKGDK